MDAKMSWLAKSIASSLAVNDAAGNSPEDDREVNDKGSESFPSRPSSQPEDQQGRGVKDDLSEIKNKLARQLRGVASFLAPPPQTNLKNDDELESEEADLEKIGGIRSDFAEIRGKVMAGISNLLQMQPDDGEDECSDKSVVGVTEEVLSFVRDIALHPGTWLRFPLPEDADADDFAMNDSQQVHVQSVERQVLELADLRWELCPDYMSEGRFWMIYFVLVHPKLDKYDALTLSTHEIVEARAMLTQESKCRRKVKQPVASDVQKGLEQSVDPSMKDLPTGSSATDSTLEGASAELDTQKHHNPSDEDPGRKIASAVDYWKQVKVNSNGSSEVLVQPEDVEDNSWLNEETSRHIPIANDEDISFSDLEDDDVIISEKPGK